MEAMFAKTLGIDPIRLAQHHESEKRRLLEGNRVLGEMEQEATEAARREAGDGSADQARRKQARLERNRERVAENPEPLREKWGVNG